MKLQEHFINLFSQNLKQDNFKNNGSIEHILQRTLETSFFSQIVLFVAAFKLILFFDGKLSTPFMQVPWL